MGKLIVLSGLTRKSQLEVAGNQKPKSWQTAVKTLKIDKCSLGKWGGGGVVTGQLEYYWHFSRNVYWFFLFPFVVDRLLQILRQFSKHNMFLDKDSSVLSFSSRK
jgi:hypothetical protein